MIVFFTKVDNIDYGFVVLVLFAAYCFELPVCLVCLVLKTVCLEVWVYTFSVVWSTHFYTFLSLSF